MAQLRRLAMAVAVAISGMLLPVGATRAHGGAAHASHAMDGLAGLGGLLAVVFAAGIVYWVTNRDDRPAADADRLESSE